MRPSGARNEDHSSIQHLQFQTVLSAPFGPSELNLTSMNSSAISVGWTALETLNRPLDGYEIAIAVSGCEKFKWTDVENSSSYFEFADLIINTSYDVRLRAFNLDTNLKRIRSGFAELRFELCKWCEFIRWPGIDAPSTRNYRFRRALSLQRRICHPRSLWMSS